MTKINTKPFNERQPDVESDQIIQTQSEYDQTVAAVNAALANIDDCENWPTHEEVFAQLRRKHNIK